MPLYGEVVVIGRNGADGAHFALTNHQVLFGRTIDCDIRIQLPDVAKLHCCLHVNENEEVHLTSLNHFYPTRLNGVVITESERIYHMDLFSISDRSFRYEFPIYSAQRLIRRRPIETFGEDADNEIVIASALDTDDKGLVTNFQDYHKTLSAISSYPIHRSYKDIAVSQIDESEYGSRAGDFRTDDDVEIAERKAAPEVSVAYLGSAGNLTSERKRGVSTTALPSWSGSDMDQQNHCGTETMKAVAKEEKPNEFSPAVSHMALHGKADEPSETSSGVWDDADSQIFSSVKGGMGGDTTTASSGVWEDANSRTSSTRTCPSSVSGGSTVFDDAQGNIEDMKTEGGQKNTEGDVLVTQMHSGKHVIRDDDTGSRTNASSVSETSTTVFDDAKDVVPDAKDISNAETSHGDVQATQVHSGMQVVEEEEADAVWADAQDSLDVERSEETEKWQDASDQIIPEGNQDGMHNVSSLDANEEMGSKPPQPIEAVAIIKSNGGQVVEEQAVSPKCSDVLSSSQTETVKEQVQIQESNLSQSFREGQELKAEDRPTKETEPSDGNQKLNEIASSGGDDGRDTDEHIAKALEGAEDKEEVEESKDIEVDETACLEMEEMMSEGEKQEKKNEAQEHKKSGNELFKKGEFLDAVYAYTQALDVCPLSFKKERSVMFANRAASQVRLEHHDEAIQDCSKALDLNPVYLKVWLRRAQVYELTEKLDESLADYQKALELDPGNYEARAACMRLPEQIKERNEKLKEEMIGKLKDLGNLVLRPFGLSTDNFQLQQDPNSGGYSVNFNRNPTNGK